jgi:hypothetical protein
MFVALVVNALIVFIVLDALAMYHRKQSTIHARYMLCTASPMFTPILDRIVYNYFLSLLNYVPIIEGQPTVPIIVFVMADLMLIGR